MNLQNHVPKTTYYLDEGDLNSVGDVLTEFGEAQGYRFANQIDKETFVELVDTRTVGKASKSATGITISKAERSFDLAPTKKADLPELRYATVVKFVPNSIYSLPLSDKNTKIAAGDFLVIDTDGKLTKGTTTDSGARAEESKEANTGGYIEVSITGKAGIDVKSNG